jgi:large subunit ribosomal protein L25
LELHELKTTIRTKVGNGPARVLRRDKKIPAVLYGPGIQPMLLTVNVPDLEKVIKDSKTDQVLVNLIVENGGSVTKSAMIKDMQVDPVSNSFVHVDFYEIAMDRKINVMVPIRTIGNAAGVEVGGLLQIIRRELEVSCLPHHIPEVIEIDVTDLNIGDSIHVQEIGLPEHVDIATEANFTVLTVGSQKTEEAEVQEESEILEEDAVTGEESESAGE